MPLRVQSAPKRFVYLLRSVPTGQPYVGLTSDVQMRLAAHNVPRLSRGHEVRLDQFLIELFLQRLHGRDVDRRRGDQGPQLAEEIGLTGRRIEHDQHARLGRAQVAEPVMHATRDEGHRTGLAHELLAFDREFDLALDDTQGFVHQVVHVVINGGDANLQIVEFERSTRLLAGDPRPDGEQAGEVEILAF